MTGLSTAQRIVLPCFQALSIDAVPSFAVSVRFSFYKKSQGPALASFLKKRR